MSGSLKHDYIYFIRLLVLYSHDYELWITPEHLEDLSRPSHCSMDEDGRLTKFGGLPRLLETTCHQVTVSEPGSKDVLLGGRLLLRG